MRLRMLGVLVTCLLSIGGAYGGVTGDGNALEGAGDITWSGTTNPLYPLTNLRSGFANRPWKAAAVGTDEYLTVNLRRWLTGSFEGASLAADGWTATGTAARSTAQHRTGVASALLAVGDTAYRTINVPAGSWQYVDAYAYSAGGGFARVYIYNPQTGNYWDDGAWSDNPAPAMNATADAGWTTWHSTVNGPMLVQMESAAVCGSHKTQLQVLIRAHGIASVYFDDVDVWPRVNSIVIAGHNLTPRVEVAVDGSGAPAIVVQPGAFYGYSASMVTSASVNVTFNGTPNDPISIGGLWLGYMQEVSHPKKETSIANAYRQATARGYTRVQGLQEERTLPLDFEFGEGDGLTPRENYEAFRDAFLRPAQGMAYPFALAYDVEDDPGMVLIGKLTERGWTVSREGALWKVSLTVQELELPNETS